MRGTVAYEFVATIRIETVVPAPPADVFDLARDLDFHTRSLAHTGERIVSGKRGGLIDLGEEVEWEARHLGITWRLRSRITAFDRPHTFTDEQVSGPFASFVHRHTFESDGAGTLMIDAWTHTPPLGVLGKLADVGLRGYVERLLRTRNAALVLEATRRSSGR
jgi:ligand-binding SRPBCC domain-containing protein